MFVLPLGLKAKPRRIPWATFAIVLITILFSLYRMEGGHTYAKSLLNSEGFAQLIHARARLLSSACETTELSPGDCQFVGHLFTTEQTFAPTLHPAMFQARLIRSIQDHYGDRAPKILSTLKPLIFEDSHWGRQDLDLRANPDFALYLKARGVFEDERKKLNATHVKLSRDTVSLRALVEAQLTHAGWMHLLGNMIFFLLLAIVAEERVGAGGLISTYLVGGSIGLLVQIFMFADPGQPLLGASANVSAIIGLFMSVFWRKPMRIWISAFFVWNREVLIPTWIFIPVFMVSMDITGSIANNSNVAHLAHLGGFAVGALIGLAVRGLDPLPEEFVFPFELKLFTAAKAATGDRRLALLNLVLYHHPDNRAALDLASESVATVGTEPFARLTPLAKGFLKLHFTSIFNRRLSGEGRAFLGFISRFHLDWPLSKLLHEVDLQKLSDAGKTAESEGDHDSAQRLLGILHDFSPTEGAKNQFADHPSATQRRTRHG